jgi:hypothetical protein
MLIYNIVLSWSKPRDIQSTTSRCQLVYTQKGRIQSEGADCWLAQQKSNKTELGKKYHIDQYQPHVDNGIIPSP